MGRFELVNGLFNIIIDINILKLATALNLHKTIVIFLEEFLSVMSPKRLIAK